MATTLWHIPVVCSRDSWKWLIISTYLIRFIVNNSFFWLSLSDNLVEYTTIVPLILSDDCWWHNPASNSRLANCDEHHQIETGVHKPYDNTYSALSSDRCLTQLRSQYVRRWNTSVARFNSSCRRTISTLLQRVATLESDMSPVDLFCFVPTAFIYSPVFEWRLMFRITLSIVF